MVLTVQPGLLVQLVHKDHKVRRELLLLSTPFNFSVALVKLALKVFGLGCLLGT
jgi:hypothetical protein